MRKTFEISDETEVRLWYMRNTYEHLSKKESTLQDAALYSGQVWHYLDWILIRWRVPGIKGYMHILCLSCNMKKSKTTAKLYKESRNRCCSNCFWWYPLWRRCLYCYCFFLPSLNMNYVPEKLYIGQWPCIANIYPVSAIWLLK